MSTMAIRRLPLGDVRRLPLGRLPHRRLHGWGLGQDDGEDDDFSDASLNLISTPTTSFDMMDSILPTAPDIGASDIESGLAPVGFVGPTEAGDIAGENPGTQLNAAILAGTTPPPIGGALTSQQAQALNAAGASPDQVGQILSGQTSYSAVMQSLGAATTAVAAAAKVLSSSQTGLRPSPVTCPTAPTGYTYTLNAAGQCSLMQGTGLSASLSAATVIPGVPNYLLLFGAAAIVIAMSASK
jgi:hypothetical protein